VDYVTARAYTQKQSGLCNIILRKFKTSDETQYSNETKYLSKTKFSSETKISDETNISKETKF
jgi:hypothetical protein